MTRKDYEAIASVFREYLRDIEDFPTTDEKDEHQKEAALNIATRLSQAFMQDNPRFLKSRFMSACKEK